MIGIPSGPLRRLLEKEPARLVPEIPLRDLAQLLNGELGRAWQKYARALEKRGKLKPRRVRRLRRAGRRLQTALTVAHWAWPGGTIQTARRHLRKGLRPVGKLRDCDVMLDLLAGEAEGLPKAAELRRALVGDRKRLRRQAERRLHPGKLRRALRAALKRTARPLDRFARERIDAGLARAFTAVTRELRREHGAVSLHPLRASLRKYRSRQGALGNAVGAPASASREKPLRSLMGELHDLEVLDERWRRWRQMRTAAPLLVKQGQALRERYLAK